MATTVAVITQNELLLIELPPKKVSACIEYDIWRGRWWAGEGEGMGQGDKLLVRLQART